MDDYKSGDISETVTIIVFILLPLLLLPIRLLPNATIRILLYIFLVGLSLIACFITKSTKPMHLKVIGVLFILPIIISASLLSAFPENISGIAEVMSFNNNLTPSVDHPLGTDYKGRDILSSIIIGGGNTYSIAIVATLFASFMGMILGLLLAQKNKIIKLPAQFVTEIFEIVPWIFFLIIIIGVLHVWLDVTDYSPSNQVKVVTAGILVGLTSMPLIARLVHRLIEKNEQMGYVLALRASAVPRYKILLYNLLYKNVLRHVIIQISFLLGFIILIDTTLEYILSIGFGEYGKADYLSWGKILADARHSAIFGEKL